MSAFENNEENARTIAEALREHRVIQFNLRPRPGRAALAVHLAAPRAILSSERRTNVQPHFFGWLDGEVPTTLTFAVSQSDVMAYFDRAGKLNKDDRSDLGRFISTVFKIYVTLDPGPQRRDGATLDDPLVIRLPF